jgi:hypothetical protein
VVFAVEYGLSIASALVGYDDSLKFRLSLEGVMNIDQRGYGSGTYASDRRREDGLRR